MPVPAHARVFRASARLVAGLALACAALPAVAQTRPLTPAMTCADAQALVKRQGAVVLGFSQNTYDRVVSDARYCIIGQTLIPEFAPTRDTPRCFVGYVCREFEIEPN